MNPKAFERKDQLMAAALEEFTDKDYEKASLNTIIKNANLSKGVFYYHFQNKESLYLALLEDSFTKKWQYIKSHTDNEDFYTQDIFDRFISQAKASMRFANEYPQYYKLGRMFQKEKGNPIFSTVLKHIESSDPDILDEMIKKAYQKGEINNQYPVEFTIKLMHHLFLEFETIFFQDMDHDLQDITDILERYVLFMRHGLTP